jgi:hypothetical protein
MDDTKKNQNKRTLKAIEFFCGMGGMVCLYVHM